MCDTKKIIERLLSGRAMILAILQARMSSRRLPGKVLKPILGRPMLGLQIERLQRVKNISHLVVATSEDGADDVIVNFCQSIRVACFRGSLHDVLDRFYQVAKQYKSQQVLRITGDCPLIDPEVVAAVIEQHLLQDNDYTSNILPATFPDGLDVEIFRFSCLEKAWREAGLSSEREHVTPYIYRKDVGFKVANYECAGDYSKMRWTVDELIDFQLVNYIYEALYPQKNDFNMWDILMLLQQNPEWARLNNQIPRNIGYSNSLYNDFIRE